MFYGKLIGGALGLLAGGVFGLILGAVVGHLFDLGLDAAKQIADPDRVARIQRTFFEASFQLQGFLAKADGRISEQEVAHTEEIIRQMRLGPDQRKEAIALFQQGAAADFQPEPVIREFIAASGMHPHLRQTLLLFLVSLALSDQKVDAAEHQALSRIATAMGVSQAQLDQLLRMAQAQARFHTGGTSGGYSGSQGGGYAGAASSGNRLADAYAALGITADASDKELKQAYRKLMSENHPDKLIAQGVPEHMVKMATAKSQDIQAAYELIREQRGIRR